MILRRFMEHIRDQNWFAVGLDVLVVVVGIFLGLQVTNWNEEKKYQENADAYIDRIVIDLESYLLSANRTAEYFGEALRNAELALSAYEKPVSEAGVGFLINIYQASQNTNLRPGRAAYDEFIQAGALVQFVDSDFRVRLGNYYQRQIAINLALDDKTGFREEISKSMQSGIQKLIREHCGDRYAETAEGVTYIYLQTECSIELSDQIVKEEVMKLHRDERLKGELAFHVRVLNSKIGALRNVSDITERLLISIKAERA